VHFQRLRLSGFKSFVDPVELRIESGVTGVVGPNGCGKSNLLEALRWVMGANSAKAMRGAEMDDVIFAGNSSRPSRNHAEVVLTIDNGARRAPAQFNDHDVLEVSRRIDRGMGSTYRINGREVRARDVQLLFADASTGANSPALVRQGQISELIAAKPQNRRLILEEAAGVAGLHSRRHEAELRLRAAETNLTRIEDLIGELDSAATRLRREARQAEAYKRISAEIRVLQSAVLFARWTEARDGLERIETDMQEAARAVELTAGASATATAEAIRAEEAIRPLRDEEMAASAILHRLAVEKDRLEHESQRIEAEAARLADTLKRIDLDNAREEIITGDAETAIARLSEEIDRLKAEIAAAPERAPQLEAAWKLAESERARTETEVLRLNAEAAAEEARRDAAASRVADAQNRVGRAGRALDMARADRAALGAAGEDLAGLSAKKRLEAAEAALAQARADVEAAEAGRADAARKEAEARVQARKTEDQLGRLKTEARGLAQLLTPERKQSFRRALDEVSAERGFEAALAAALGDDLNAALDRKAAAFWGGGKAPAPAWPKGVTPLATAVRAPDELAARLAFTGLVERDDGDRLQAELKPGMRLVSREGDLWRWDGFVARAEAPRPAAVRLAQKARLEELETEIEKLTPGVKAATEEMARLAAALAAAEKAAQASRGALPPAEREIALARDDVERHAREAARRDARAQSLDETIGRFETEKGEAETALERARAEAEALPATADLEPQLEAARAVAATAREAASKARADLDMERREREGRAQRLETLEHDAEAWTERSRHAVERIEQLARERAKTLAAQEASRDAPAALEARKLDLLDELATAETRLSAATDAFAAADAARTAADREARAAEHRASEARELKAGLTARLDGARERLQESAAAIRETAFREPEELGAMLAEQSPKPSSMDAQQVEQRLHSLERQRETIGAVNLRADEEAAEYGERLKNLRSERADLQGAVGKLRRGIEELNGEGRERLLAAFDVINGHFQALFKALFEGGQAELRLVESEDPLEAGLEIFACPPGKRLATMSLMSGGEQALTAAALIFGVFLAQPAPICVMDEVDAPLDDHNVDRFCNLMNEMRARTETRFICITHNPVTMSRMDRLYGVTMPERGVSQLVSVDLRQAEALAAE
jgi:chromosome segregation protein